MTCVLRIKKNKVGTLSLVRGIREDEGCMNEEYVQDCIWTAFKPK